jgi:multiple sugar transport system permease protein
MAAIHISKKRFGIAHLVGLLLILFFCVFPFYWMVSSSLKDPQLILSQKPTLTFQPTLENYRDAFQRNVGGSLGISLFVALTTTAVSLLLGTPAAYALARFDFKGKKDIWFWFITNRMVSPIVLALPFFLLASNFHLIGNPIVLVFIYLTFNVPIVVWICSDQFRGIPKELDEAATLEGYNSFSIFWRVALPLGAPGIAVSAIFCFIFSWNELLYALILMRRETQTAPVVATSFMSGYQVPWGQIMATGTLVALPVIIFSLIVSRQMVRGLTMGAIK